LSFTTLYLECTASSGSPPIRYPWPQPFVTQAHTRSACFGILFKSHAPPPIVYHASAFRLSTLNPHTTPTMPPHTSSKFTELLDTTASSSYNSALNVSLEDILAETAARRRSSSGSEGASNPRTGQNSPTSPTSPTIAEATKSRLRRISLMSKHR